MTQIMLTARDIHIAYRLGRDLSLLLVAKLPGSITIGAAGPGRFRRLARREAVENLLTKASREGLPLWALLKEHDTEGIAAWLADGKGSH